MPSRPRPRSTRRPTTAPPTCPTGAALVDPARLAWGLAAAARAAGVSVYERSPVARLERAGEGVRATTPAGFAVRAPPRRAGHQRVPAAGARHPALRRAGLRLRARLRAARPRAARVAWLGAPPGADRHGQPVPLLPADERRPRPVRRLRRDLQLPQRDGPAPRRAAGLVRAAGQPLLRDLPPARRASVHPSLGWRDRHLLALLGDVRLRARRPGRVRGRLHRPRRRREPLRRPGGARPRRRP